MPSLLSNLFLYNPIAKFFRASRPAEERQDKEEIENSVGVSQEQIDLHSVIDTSYLLSPGSAISYVGISFEQFFASKHGRIQKYKEMSLFPEISDGLDAVSDEAIVANPQGNVVDLDIVEEMPSHIEEEVRKIWDYLINDVYAINERGWEFFRKFLIESELYIENILNEEGNNIIGIKVLPAHTMIPIYEDNKIRGFMQTKVGNPQAQDVRQQQQGSVVFDKDQISYVNFGLIGVNMLDVRGYLESTIRVYNQLKNLEDALVVYKLIRAPSRRVWNIAVGRMPKTKAEEYLKGLIQRYKKKIIYNADTGAVDSTANIQAMTEDFWFTRNENGEGTTVEEIGGTMQLGELTDINYFLQKLYKSLKLPKSRWEDSASSMYSSGKSGEILREEIKFSKFVERIQNRFKYILLNPFITLLRLKGIDERYIKEDHFKITFTKSNLFKEYKELELVESRMGILDRISNFIYDKNVNPQGLFAKEFALKHFFKMSEEEWTENEELKKKEEMQTKSNPNAEPSMGGFGAGPTPTGGFGVAAPPPEAGLETPPTETPEAAPAPETAAPTTAPESYSYNKNKKELNLFENWEKLDKNIKERYNHKN
jgi:hypothetical protein